jgi:hypothetical protein
VCEKAVGFCSSCCSSSGSFQDTSIADWYEDAETALTLAPAKKHVLVGALAKPNARTLPVTTACLLVAMSLSMAMFNVL